MQIKRGCNKINRYFKNSIILLDKIKITTFIFEVDLKMEYKLVWKERGNDQNESRATKC
jgi:hypothetical protein